MILRRLTLLLLCVLPAFGAHAQSLDEIRSLLQQGQVDRALAAIDARLLVDASDRQTRFLKGVALAEKPDADAAIKVFTALTRDHPNLPEPYNNLAVLYASKQNYDKARDALLQAINTHPSYATAHENLGDIYAKMAGLAYTRALSLDTGNDVAKGKLALIGDLFSPPSKSVQLAAVAPASKQPAILARAVPSPVSEPVITERVNNESKAAVKIPAKAPARVDTKGAVDAAQAWAKAWSAQNINQYLSYYMPNVSPDPSMSRSNWEQHRRVRLSKPGKVSVKLKNFQVKEQGADRVDVTFEQNYRSDNYTDRVRKRLTMHRTQSGWKIRNERTVATL